MSLKMILAMRRKRQTKDIEIGMVWYRVSGQGNILEGMTTNGSLPAQSEIMPPIDSQIKFPPILISPRYNS